MAWWLGIGIGIGLMGGHAALRLLTHRLALRRADAHSFLLFELGGLGGRMVLLLCAVALVLTLVPVDEAAFVGTVLLLLVISLIVEVRLVVRHLNRDALSQ